MAEAFETTRWRTFDGKDFASEAEADAYEEANFLTSISALTPEMVHAALARDPRAVYVANAIERAAAIIRKARYAAGEFKRARNGDKAGVSESAPAAPESATVTPDAAEAA